MWILNLPLELVYTVVLHLSDGDLNALIRAGSREMTQLLLPLLKERKDPRIPLLCYAAKNSNSRVIQHLLKDPTTDIECVPDIGDHYDDRYGGWTPLHFAAANNCPQACKLLLDAGASPDTWANLNMDFNTHGSALHYASWHGYIEVVRVLLQHHACTDVQTCLFHDIMNTPLVFAIMGRQTETVRVLLDYGADPNMTNEEWNEDFMMDPLHFAVLIGNVDMVQLLIKANADVGSWCSIPGGWPWYVLNRYRCYGATALHLAAATDNKSIIKILLEEAVFSVDESSWMGVTVLTFAIRCSCDWETVRLLLDYGADPTQYGIPLHVLEEAREDGYRLDFSGARHPINKSAIEMAVEKQNLGVLKELLNHPNVAKARDEKPELLFKILQNSLIEAEKMDAEDISKFVQEKLEELTAGREDVNAPYAMH